MDGGGYSLIVLSCPSPWALRCEPGGSFFNEEVHSDLVADKLVPELRYVPHPLDAGGSVPGFYCAGGESEYAEILSVGVAVYISVNRSVY